MAISLSRWTRSARSSRCTKPSVRIRQITTSALEIIWEMMVAQATPATPMLKPMTNSRFSTTFTMPEAIRKYSGRRVSPTARSTAAPKLYSMLKGMPRK